MPLIPAFRRQRQVDLCDSKAGLAYQAYFRIAMAVTQRNPVSKKQKQKQKGIIKPVQLFVY